MSVEDEIKAALAKVKQNRVLGIKTTPVQRARDAEDEKRYNTYIRSNTVTNIARVVEAYEQDGELKLESTYIDITKHEVPSKRQVKHMAGNKMQPSSRVFRTTGPGSSRSRVLDMLKAISADETGCVVLEPQKSRQLRKIQKPTTLPNSASTGMRFNGGVE